MYKVCHHSQETTWHFIACSSGYACLLTKQKCKHLIACETGKLYGVTNINLQAKRAAAKAATVPTPRLQNLYFRKTSTLERGFETTLLSHRYQIINYMNLGITLTSLKHTTVMTMTITVMAVSIATATAITIPVV